jgi:hypothetical protein
MNLINLTIKLIAPTFALQSHSYLPFFWLFLMSLAIFFFNSTSIEMSVGDITRLNRMYNCPIYEAPASRIVNGTSTKNSTQFPNGADVGQVRLNITKDHTNDLAEVDEKNEMKLNSNETHTGNDDDMILTKEQIDALYSLNAAKRNGLKSAFHHWPLGLVPFEIDPTFRKTFTAFLHFLSPSSSIYFPPQRRSPVDSKLSCFVSARNIKQERQQVERGRRGRRSEH